MSWDPDGYPPGMTPSLEPTHFPSQESTGSDWHWRLEDADGAEVTGEVDSPAFPSQGDAESWVGEEWRDLLEAGVEQVRLLDGAREVYGPMSLRPPAG